MKLSNYKNIGIAIVIGIVSSGLWKFLSESVAPKITTYFISVSSSFSNKVFVQISSHNLAALQQSTYSLVVITSFLLIAVIAGLLYFLLMYCKDEINKTKHKAYQLHKEISGIEDSQREDIDEQEFRESYENFINDVEKTDKSVKRLFLITSIVMPAALVILMITSVYNTLTLKYIYESTTYFDYLLKVNAENLDDKTEKQYMSRFTQIRNSKDYTTLVIELEKLALEKGLSFLPNPTIRKEKDLIKDHPNSKSIYWDSF